MVKKVVIQAIKLHNNKPKPSPQATAKKQAPLRTPLLLTSTTATTDKAYTNSTDTTVANAAKQVETDSTAVQKAEKALEKAVDQVKTDAGAKDFDETTFTKVQTAEQTAEKALETAENKLTQD
ncbi:hypothetical protein JP0074_06350 [Helicobacter pylori]|nr:hypothetical protein JP0074_06350 [Helicobacter pylori]